MGNTQWVRDDPGSGRTLTQQASWLTIVLDMDNRTCPGPAWLVVTPQGVAELRVDADDEIVLIALERAPETATERSRDPRAYGAN